MAGGVCVVWLEKGFIEQCGGSVVSGMGSMGQGYLELVGREGRQRTERGTLKRRIWDVIHNCTRLGDIGGGLGCLT
jgi:hypothetical protein